MSHELKIPRNACVVVGDGRKALFLRNVGDQVHPDLRIERVEESPANPSTRSQGTDRPGRVAMGTHRSAVGQTDWHDRAERSFAAGVAATLEALCRDGRTPAIVIAAPPRTLAELREACPDALKRLIVAEIDKDLTKLPTDEIERYLTR